MTSKKFIDIRQVIKSKNPKLAKWLPGFIINYLKRILHEDEINNFIAKNGHLYNEEFCKEVMKYFNIKVEVIGLEKIPQNGRVILAMNHPLGGMDAIALVSAIHHHRPDIKFIVNDLLMNLENLRDLFVGVNKHGKNATSTRQQIMDLFASEQMVCIFPAGLVSRREKGKIRDLEWKKTFVTYAKKYHHQVVPVYIDGRLSNFFYNLSSLRKFFGIKANIEMLYLSNELFKQRDKTMRFTVGNSISGAELSNEVSEMDLAQQIKEKVYELENKI